MTSTTVSVAAMCLGGILFLSANASEYCTKEQYARDRALIAEAFKNGTLTKGPKGLRDSILVEEKAWYQRNYLQQIAFMQSYECSLGAGKKQFLYLDVRSLATGRLLATWTLGGLKPAEDLTNPGMSERNEDENRIGLTGEARAAFIKSAADECNKHSTPARPTYCSCYANAMADSLSIRELNATRNLATMTALRPKLEAAAKSCQ